ncbi:SIMPL domain-containing protein [Candidatus Bathyarchaeota archaeon]|nr:SIMPL domain-containing protein [Candidatus Bathyarchaeota archaeon]
MKALEKTKIIFTVVIIVAISTLLLMLTFTPENSAAIDENEEAKSTLSVMGVSSMNVQPDLASVALTVEVKARNASEAMRENAEIMSRVISALKQLGLEDDEIRTRRVGLYPEYFYPKDKPPVLIGYRAVNSITVTTGKFDILGLIIDTAVANGVNKVEGVWFTLSKELQDSVKLQLISSAVENAKLKAEAALEPLGMSITGVKTIEVKETGWYYPVVYKEAAGTAATTPIMPGEIEVTVMVYVVFYIG